MNYASRGRDLLLELQPSRAGGPKTGLPAYNTTLVRDALQDLTLHVQALQDQVNAAQMSGATEPPIEIRPSLKLQKEAILRLKRCLLTYHKVRADRLQDEGCWNQDPELASRLSPSEAEFLEKYRSLVSKHSQTVLGDPDFWGHKQSRPPVPLDRIQVRALVTQDTPVLLESGTTVQWKQGSLYYLDLTDVQEYIRQGVLAPAQG